MDIKKLYVNVCVAAGEIPLYLFLMHCDTFASMLIAKYGGEYVLGEGDYVPPASLEDSYAVNEEFYHAAFLYIKAAAGGADLSESLCEADKAYLTLWRKKAKNMRIKGAKW